MIWSLPFVSSKSTGRHFIKVMGTKLAVLVLLACFVVAQCLKGEFKFKDYTCKYWEEGGGHGKGPRLLVINCPKGNISCKYRGNPHACPWYNKNNNQPIYYQCLADKLAKDIVSPCNPASVVCKKHCEEITFNKTEEASHGKHESLVFERLRVIEEVEDDEENIYN